MVCDDFYHVEQWLMVGLDGSWRWLLMVSSSWWLRIAASRGQHLNSSVLTANQSAPNKLPAKLELFTLLKCELGATAEVQGCAMVTGYKAMTHHRGCPPSHSRILTADFNTWMIHLERHVCITTGTCLTQWRSGYIWSYFGVKFQQLFLTRLEVPPITEPIAVAARLTNTAMGRCETQFHCLHPAIA